VRVPHSVSQFLEETFDLEKFVIFNLFAVFAVEF